MTHLDTDVKHCAADLLFVLCKENGKTRPARLLCMNERHWTNLFRHKDKKRQQMVFINFHFCVIPYPLLLLLPLLLPPAPVRRFVKYTGYGNAAGLLATRGLLCGQGGRRMSLSAGSYSSDSDSDTEEYRQVKDRINPVTGRVEVEHSNPMEGMTEEEKEEEAKTLMMLFNKLSRSVTPHKTLTWETGELKT